MWKNIRLFLILLLLLIETAIPVNAETNTTSNLVFVPEISAQTAVLMEISTGRILYEKNKDQKAYPASTTKIMTALLALETDDLDVSIKVPQKAVGVEGSSIYLEAGERISLRDLVYGLMLRSGNDAAVTIAETQGKGTKKFIRKMNKRANQIGALNTNFTNPNGLFDEMHYTTAYDMALMSREAMQNSEFRKIVGARSWQAKRGSGNYNFFSNKNKVVYEYSGALGIKIGYTKGSGRTLVASSKRNGMELICVVMNAPNWFSDSYKLMDYGYEKYEAIKKIKAKEVLKAEPLIFGEKDHVFIGAKEDILLPTIKGYGDGECIEEYSLIYENKDLPKAPISRWQEAGAVSIYLNGEFLCKKKLYYLEDVERLKKDYSFWFDN